MEKKIFKGFLSSMDMPAILVMSYRCAEQTFVLQPTEAPYEIALTGPAVLEMFEIVDRRTTDRRTDKGACLYF